MKRFVPILFLLAAHSGAGRSVWVAFDTETTGLSPAKERVIEIGAAKLVDGKIVETKRWLINPGRPIPNSRIHHITDEMVAGAMDFPEAYRSFRAFAGTNSILLAHNASFDVRFMKAEIERNRLDPLPNPVIDTLALFRRWYPGLSSYRLGRIAEQLNLSVPVRHRAAEDAETLLRIFRDGLRKHSDPNLETIRQTAGPFYFLDGSRK